MFEKRSDKLELLDGENFDPQLAVKSYLFMERVNRLFGGTRNVRLFLEEEAKNGQPLHILDVGSGSCDIPIALCAWASQKGINLKFTCLEIEPHAVEIAKAKLAKSPELPIQLLQEDAFTHHPDSPYSCAVSSMCFHHFSDRRILDLLRHLKDLVRGGILINDLQRSPLAWLGAMALSSISDEGVKHDSRLSVKRGFKVDELRSLLSQLEDASVAVEAKWLFRIKAVVRFAKETPS